MVSGRVAAGALLVCALFAASAGAQPVPAGIALVGEPSARHVARFYYSLGCRACRQRAAGVLGEVEKHAELGQVRFELVDVGDAAELPTSQDTQVYATIQRLSPGGSQALACILATDGSDAHVDALKQLLARIGSFSLVRRQNAEAEIAEAVGVVESAFGELGARARKRGCDAGRATAMLSANNALWRAARAALPGASIDGSLLASLDDFSARLHDAVATDTHGWKTFNGVAASYLPRIDAAVTVVASPDRTFVLPDRSWTAAFAPNDRFLMIGMANGTLQFRNLETLEALNFRVHRHNVLAANFAPDGTSYVTASVDGTAKLWSDSGGGARFTFDAHSGGQPACATTECSRHVTWAGYSPDAKRIVTTGRDGYARIWDSATGGLVEQYALAVGKPAQRADFAADGVRLLAATNERVSLIDTRNRKTIVEIRPPGFVSSAVLSPDGKRITTIGYDQTARVYDLAGKQLGVIHAPTVLKWAAFSPDGRWLALAAFKQGRLVDLTTGRQTRILDGHTDDIFRLEFSHSGQYIVTASGDRTVRVWPLR